MTPGEAIKEHLIRKGWSQSDLAAVLGMSRGHVSDVVRGARGIGLEMALRLAAAFDTEPDYWLRLEAALKLAAATERLARLQETPRAAATPLAVALQENAHLRSLLRAFVDEEPCRLDHHGNCQAHNLSNPCDVARARVLLGLEPTG